MPTSELVRAMARARVPAAFSRSDWAYLLEAVRALPQRPAGRTPRDPVVLWLPGNVALLGAHAVTLAAWTGARVVAKLPTDAPADLTEAWVGWLHEHGTLADRVKLTRCGHDAAAALSATAGARIVFGSDEAVAAIRALPHRPGASWAGFGARRSEAWIDREAAHDPEAVRALVKAFAVFGRAGCTSPARAVLVDGTPAEADALRDRLVAAWPSVVLEPVEMHRASQNAMAEQVAAARGFAPLRTAGGSAVVASGPASAGDLPGPTTLPVVAATLREAAETAPANLQTVGHATADPAAWATTVGTTAACRFVSLADMHVFGPVWDSQDWWADLWR